MDRIVFSGVVLGDFPTRSLSVFLWCVVVGSANPSDSCELI